MDIVKRRATAFLSGIHKKLGLSSRLMTLSPYIVQKIAMMYVLSEQKLRLIVGRDGRIDIVNPYTGNRRTLYNDSVLKRFPWHSLLAINGRLIKLTRYDVTPFDEIHGMRNSTIFEYIDDDETGSDVFDSRRDIGGKLYTSVTDKLQWSPKDHMIYLPSRTIVKTVYCSSTDMFTVFCLHIPTMSIYSTPLHGFPIGSVGIDKNTAVIVSINGSSNTISFAVIQQNNQSIVRTVDYVDKYTPGDVQNIGNGVTAVVTYESQLCSNAIVYLYYHNSGKTARVFVDGPYDGFSFAGGSIRYSSGLIDGYTFVCSSVLVVLWRTTICKDRLSYRMHSYNASTGKCICSIKLGTYSTSGPQIQLPVFCGKTENSVLIAEDKCIRVFDVSMKDMTLSETREPERIEGDPTIGSRMYLNEFISDTSTAEYSNLDWTTYTLLCPGTHNLQCVRNVRVFDGVEMTPRIDVSYGTGPVTVYGIVTK